VHVVIYLLLSLVVGLVGRNRPIGFLGYFLLSIIVTPVVTLLTILVIKYLGRRQQRALMAGKCPACAQPLLPPQAAKYCAQCGARV
jgi:hypothetical protein